MTTPVHLCYDRIVKPEHKTNTAMASIAENSANDPKHILLPGVSAHPQKIAMLTGKRWANGRLLTVRFLDGSRKQRSQTQRFAEQWLPHMSLKLGFVSRGTADLRISFRADPGSWSAVGTDSLDRASFPASAPTMNLGWLRDDTLDAEWRRVVVHEFGHALGCIHEHQTPLGGPIWNTKAVYAYFGGPPNNWTRSEIVSNVLYKYSVAQANGTAFDPDSIMLYSFPAELMKDGKATRENNELSPLDKAQMARWYPR